MSINPENGFYYTGIAASKEEERAMRDAYKVPLMVIGNSVPPSPEEVMHACALGHGLPEIVGYYGYDYQRHEFIRLPDADKGEPDKWPSRRLSDILEASGLRRSSS